MNSSQNEGAREFRFGGGARVWAWCGVALGIVYLLSFWGPLLLGVQSPKVYRITAGSPGLFWLAYCGWQLWLGRRLPILSIGEDVIRWREFLSPRLSALPVSDILVVERMNPGIVVVKTASRGTVNILLGGLSREDRQAIQELVRTRFEVL